MKREKKKIILGLLSGMLMLICSACSSGNEDDTSGQTNLVFQIWDQGQKSGMEAMAEAYMENHPEVEIEVQAIGWDEYWTKLEAMATSNTLPDIFWMHSNQMYKYADAGILEECTDLIDQADYSEEAVANASGSDGKIYGVPKDKDIIGLLYNKEIFDEAGVEYPDSSWTWDDLISASEIIYEKTGKYGYMAPADDQGGYWNFIYQNGGRVLTEDGTKACYTEPATQEALKFYVDLQKNEWCPTQAQFANTGVKELFFSGQGAMYFSGNWELTNLCSTYPDMNGKWDVEILPACPDPAKGNGRAVISNSVSYAMSKTGKNKEAARDFLKFLGSEEGQRIQGESGVAIPAYNGLEDSWVNTFTKNGYDIQVGRLIPQFDYCVRYQTNPSRAAWEPKVRTKMLDIYAGTVSFEEGVEDMEEIVAEEIKKW